MSELDRLRAKLRAAMPGSREAFELLDQIERLVAASNRTDAALRS